MVDIRPATPADRAAVVDFWVEAWTRAMPQLDFEARRAWIGKHLDELRDGGAALLVAVESDGPVGLVSVDCDGLIDQLVVAHAAQGRGIGGRLLDAAERHSRSGLRLSVNLDNHGAVAFYERRGFSVVSTGTNRISGLPVLNMMRDGPISLSEPAKSPR